MNEQEISDKVASNVHLVRNVVKLNMARRTLWRVFGYDDLYSAGLVGLWKAIQMYDESKSASFSTYARMRIENEIKDYLREETMARSPYKQQFDLVYRAKSLDEILSIPNDVAAGQKTLDVLGEFRKFIDSKRSSDCREERLDLLNAAIGKLPRTDRSIVRRILSGESKSAVLASVGSNIFSETGQQLMNSIFLKLIRYLGADPVNLAAVRDTSFYDPEGKSHNRNPYGVKGKHGQTDQS